MLLTIPKMILNAICKFQKGKLCIAATSITIVGKYKYFNLFKVVYKLCIYIFNEFWNLRQMNIDMLYLIVCISFSYNGHSDRNDTKGGGGKLFANFKI